MKSQPLNMKVNLTVKCMQLMIENGNTPRAVRMFFIFKFKQTKLYI